MIAGQKIIKIRKWKFIGESGLRVDCVVEVDVCAPGTSSSDIQCMQGIRKIGFRKNQCMIFE